MKTFIVTLLAALLCCGAAQAADEFANAYELYESWYVSQTDRSKSPYPDYVCGVWSTDGGMENLTFALLEGAKGEAGKADILDAVADDSTLTFVTRKYSHAELRAIQEELTSALGDETGAYGIGVYEMDNHVHIDINTDAPGAAAFMEKCYAKYGDRIAFEGGSGVLLYTSAGNENTTTTGPVMLEELGSTSSAPLLWALTAIFAVFCVGAWLLLRHRPAMQTTDGRTVTTAPPSRGEVEAALREAQTPPAPENLQAILEKIEE